jgi:hypothetical protein
MFHMFQWHVSHVALMCFMYYAHDYAGMRGIHAHARKCKCKCVSSTLRVLHGKYRRVSPLLEKSNYGGIAAIGRPKVLITT